MILTAEEVIENVRSLPKFEREKFFKLVESERNQSKNNNEDLERKNEKFRLALKWIEEHKEEFDGKFVVLDGDKLVAHGTDSKTVCNEARAKGFQSPFLARVKAKVLPFGGW
jgi:Family of unknown function (DUF5678)